VWSSSGYVAAQVIVPLRNTGPTWIELDAYSSDFSIFATDGSVTAAKSFDAEAPSMLAPGDTGYLLGEAFSSDFPRSAYASVEAQGKYQDALGPPDNPLTVLNTSVRKRSYGGLSITGQVQNDGSELVTALVAALFFDSSGEILGFARTYVDDIPAGGKKSFDFSTLFAEIKLSDVADTQFYASDTGL
jgi:hypothetical protein